jgi:Cu(I)/Ag(I) efflux system membrane protein CusA/SilA
MKPIATRMSGGVITSTIMELLVYPAIYYIWRSRAIKRLPPSEPAALPVSSSP